MGVFTLLATKLKCHQESDDDQFGSVMILPKMTKFLLFIAAAANVCNLINFHVCILSFVVSFNVDEDMLGEGDSDEEDDDSSEEDEPTREAHFFVKEVDIAGISLAEMIFNEIDPSLEVECFKKDGDSISKVTQFTKVSGKKLLLSNVRTPVIYPTASTKDAPQVESSVAKCGDSLIDINDRFPRDFRPDIFSKERLTKESSSISPPDD
ncbi:hypothetical protein IFM89_000419 [Coptis chinensis]|uniref:Uncharacterized protein n=1 Tax=Coptis chinensis TaxID=261450 RepID=A0A835I979_9MAGN|nr:hypothetical protein IFM89_000419 [Coptis chinensis]